MKSKILKILGILLILLTILVTATTIFTRTDYFKNIVKGFAEKAVNAATKQKFTIGEIKGDLIHGFKLIDVSLHIEEEPFISLNELSLKYSLPFLLKSHTLFRKVVPMDNASVSGLRVNLIRYRDNSWNFYKIVKEAGRENKHNEIPDWSVFLESFIIDNCIVTFEDKKENKSSSIEIPDLYFSLKMFNIVGRIEVDLKRGDFYILPQKMKIKGLSSKVVYENGRVQINNMEADVNGSGIKLSAEASNFKEPVFKLKASAKDLEIYEGTFNLDIEAVGRYKSLDNIQVELKLNIPDAEILKKKFSGSIEKIIIEGTKIEVRKGIVKTEFGNALFEGSAFLDRLLKTGGTNGLTINLSLENIDLSGFNKLIKVPFTGIVNADLHLKGVWKEIKELETKAKINKFHHKGEAGEISLKGIVETAGSKVNFDLISELKRINPGFILKDNKYIGDVNSNFKLKGSLNLSGHLLDNLRATLSGDILSSSISGIKIDNGKIDASYDNGLLNVKKLFFKADSFYVNAEGTGGREKEISAIYDIEVEKLNILSNFFPDLDIRGHLKADGRIQGKIKKPNMDFTLTLSDFGYKKDILVKSIQLTGETSGSIENPQFKASGNFKDIKFKERKIKSINIKAGKEDEGIKGVISIVEEPKISCEVVFNMLDIKSYEKSLVLERIKLNLNDNMIENRDSIPVKFSPNQVTVKSFNLYHEDTAILGNAFLDFDGNMDSKLELKKVDLYNISQLLNLKTPLKGIASGNINLKGSTERPVVNANVISENLEFMEFKSDMFTLNLSYANKKLNFNANAKEKDNKILLVRAGADIDLNLKKLNENLMDAFFDLSVKSDGLDLSPVSKLNEEIKTITGKAIIDFKASGKLKSPSVNGVVKLKDISLSLYSIKNTIKINNGLFKMDDQNGTLTLDIQTDEEGEGTFEGDMDFSKLTFNFKSKIKNFLIQTKGITAKLNGNMKIKGGDGRIHIGGKTEVKSVRILISEFRAQKEIKTTDEIKFVDGREEKKPQDETKETTYFKNNVAMYFTASIPGNAWIRGKGANIEVEGKAVVKKDFGKSAIIAGDIDAVRGTYNVLGKLFRIEKGKISFAGTEEINPFLDIEALHSVSDVRILVNVTGTISKPDIKLSSDPQMDENEIISYIAFGKSINKLSGGERAQFQGGAAGTIKLMGAGKMAKLAGKRLGIDMINIEGGNDEGASSKFTFGKYFSDNLYVAYERKPSQSPTKASNYSFNSLLIEYRLTNSLSLDSEIGGENPGMDIFYNLDF